MKLYTLSEALAEIERWITPYHELAMVNLYDADEAIPFPTLRRYVSMCDYERACIHGIGYPTAEWEILEPEFNEYTIGKFFEVVLWRDTITEKHVTSKHDMLIILKIKEVAR